MSVKSNNIKSDLQKVDKHRIDSSEYDELPELTDNMFERAVYRVGGVAKSPPRRRVLQKISPTIPIYIRLSPEIVAYFKSEGTDWQIKIGYALQDWIRKHPHNMRAHREQ